MAKKISKKDTKKIETLLKDGKELEAEDFFISKYILKPAQRMQGFIQKTIARVDGKILSKEQMTALTLNVSNTVSAYDANIRGLFNQFSNMFSKFLFKKYNITSPFVKSTIKNNSIAIFNTNVRGALSQTNSQLLNTIRKQQKDLIIARTKIDKAVEIGDILAKDRDKAIAKAEKAIAKLNPNIKKMEGGNFVTYKDGSLHNLKDYTDMATRTTVLNVDRTAVEVKSGVSGRRVVEYYLRDKRSVKEKRAVCNSIMHTRIKGIPMIALDQGAADILGIRTLEQAKQEDGKAFGPNCRHSIRPLSAAVYNEVEKVLFLSETEVA